MRLLSVSSFTTPPSVDDDDDDYDYDDDDDDDEDEKQRQQRQNTDTHGIFTESLSLALRFAIVFRLPLDSIKTSSTLNMNGNKQPNLINHHHLRTTHFINHRKNTNIYTI